MAVSLIRKNQKQKKQKTKLAPYFIWANKNKNTKKDDGGSVKK